MDISRILFFLILSALLITGTILLQIFLSNKENKWPGLVLPVINFSFSILAVLNIGAFTVTKIVQDGKVITSAADGQLMGTILTALYVLVLYNLPTALLLAIYAACKGKRKANAALAKMSVQDLE